MYQYQTSIFPSCIHLAVQLINAFRYWKDVEPCESLATMNVFKAIRTDNVTRLYIRITIITRRYNTQ